MKPIVKQKQPVVQLAINNALTGGGGGGNTVPEPTSGEDNYVLTADYGSTPSYSWQPASGGGTQVQADWDETDTDDPSYIQNKPTIPAAQVNSDWNAASGVAEILNKPDLSDMATKTWVGNQGYLTDADEVPTVTSSDNAKVLTATYSGGAGSYAWATPASGGLAVETDGTNYWITVNSIRLYFASSAPTGTIPNGSLGIGW